MIRIPSRLVGAACALAVVGTFTGPAVALGHQAGDNQERASAKHVLLLSIDGLHQTDLSWYTGTHPHSALASLVAGGREFTNAKTPVPSDSFPGLVAQVTGGNPRSTGVYYDDSWNRELLPAGTKSCAGAQPGAEVTYFEAADLNQHRLDAGQGLSGLPGTILQMTGNARDVIDPLQLPVDPATCTPVYPHSYLRVNTIFEVARAHGLRTAWSDKHAAYDVVNGPSGAGVQDLFTPEINSDAPTLGSKIDWTKDNLLTQQYDAYKVEAVINEIKGFDHSGAKWVGTPAIFGMNFQTVSTAQKLLKSGGQPGGYNEDGTPGPVLRGALDYINDKVGAMTDALVDRHLNKQTVVILSAKHGQSPTKPSALTRIDDGPIITALNAQWALTHPGQTLVAFNIEDDGMLLWLNDRSVPATTFAKNFLLGYSGMGVDVKGNARPFDESGLEKVYAGKAAADYFHVAHSDARVPDIFAVSQYGVVYTGGSKIAEHGGANPQDREVPLVVSGAAVKERGQDDSKVETTQIAPTILSLLGLDPDALRSVQVEGTKALPLD